MISVVIPVYNTESFLPECLDSLENQTSSNFEIVIIDDGSTDSSPQLCDDFAKTSKHHVIVRHTPNQGQLLAHRLGIQLSSGEYVAF